MIFNDYINYYNEIDRVLVNLDEYINSLKNIKQMYLNWTTGITARLSFAELTSGNYNTFNSSGKIIVSNLKLAIQKLDPFVYGPVVELERLNNTCITSDIDLEALTEAFKFVISTVHLFLSTEHTVKDLSNLIQQLLESINELEIKYYNMRKRTEMITSISETLKFNEFDSDNNAVLTLRFYDTSNTLKNYSLILKGIEDSYDRICAIADVSTQEYPIIPIKIESGSLFIKLAGNPFVVETFKLILSISFGYLADKFASRLKSVNSKNNDSKPEDFENIKGLINIIGLMKKNGIETSRSEEYIEDAMSIACKNIYAIVLSNSKIQIDSEILDISKETQASLSSSNIKYLSNESNSEIDIFKDDI